MIVELIFAEDTDFSFPPPCTSGLDCPDCIPAAGVPILPTSLPDCPAQATSGGGAYLFSNYPPRQYRVKVHETTAPAGAVLTTLDSFVAPLSGTNFLTADFGFFVPPTHDYGDAPDPYPTLLVNDGARHLPGGSYLGPAPGDLDSDGQPTAAADGDDSAGAPDDEDGVSFPGVVLAGDPMADVAVVSSGVGLLDAWIDFNADGDWSDAGEQIFTSQVLAAGVNNLNFTVPIGASVGSTFTRFRISTAGGLSYTGLAADGEVEDDVVNISAAPAMVTAHVFEDSNGNGVQDGVEAALPGVDVVFTDSLAGAQTGTTNATGDVSAVVPAGNTNADVVDATVPVGYVLTTANDPPGGALQTIVALAGSTVAFGDFGYQPPPVIGVAKQVTAVVAIAGGLVEVSYQISVENLGPVDLVNVQVTDNLTPSFPPPVTFSVPLAPVATGTLSSNAGYNGSGATGLLTAAASTLSVGATETITFTVRIDPMDQNGPFLNLAVASGENVSGVMTTDISDDGVDPDPNGNNDPTDPDEDDPTPVLLGAVSDWVWDDSNGNGIQDGAEPGHDGVTVVLLNAALAVHNTTVTAGGGIYSFSGIPAGTYSVRVTAPVGFGFTLQDQGGDDSLDSDVNPATGTSAPFALASAQVRTDLDAGLTPTPGIIGVSKQVTSITYSGGQVDVTYSLVVENLGSVVLTNVQVVDNLSATFPAPVSFVVTGDPVTTGTLTANNPGYDGISGSDTNLLVAVGSTLAASGSPGDTGTISFTLRITPNGQPGPFLNVGIASGEDPGGAPTTDISDAGVDPDPNGNGDPSDPDENDPTPVSVSIVTAHVFEDTNTNGVQDAGEPDLPGVDVTFPDSLAGVQTGTTDAMGDVSAVVPPGNTSSDVVDATVPAGYVLTTANDPPAFPMQTIVAVAGSTVAFSDYGFSPAENPVIGVSKQVTTITQIGSGLYVVDFALVVENFGDVDLSNVQVADDLAATFPAPVTFTVARPLASGTLTANAAFDGVGNQELLNAAASTLIIGANATINFTVTINTGNQTGPFFNTAIASGESPIKTTVSDISDDGADPDPNGDDDPKENNPTRIEVMHVPAVAIPTLSVWGLLLLILAVSAMASGNMRRLR